MDDYTYNLDLPDDERLRLIALLVREYRADLEDLTVEQLRQHIAGVSTMLDAMKEL